MKTLFLAITGLLLTNYCFSQQVYQIRADSVRIYNVCDTAELILENHTQDTLGFLYNKNKGRTEFRKLKLTTVGDTAIAIRGQDTMSMKTILSGKYAMNIYNSNGTLTADRNLSGGGKNLTLAGLGMFNLIATRYHLTSNIDNNTRTINTSTTNMITISSAHNVSGYSSGILVGTSANNVDRGRVIMEVRDYFGTGRYYFESKGLVLTMNTNNAAEDSVLTTDVSGMVKLKYMGPGNVVKMSNSPVTINKSSATVINISASNNPVLTLPNAASFPGRVINIVEAATSTAGQMTISPAIRLNTTTTYTNFNNVELSVKKRCAIQSDGSEWWIISY